MKVEGTNSLLQKVAAYTAFASFAYGALRDEYLQGVRLFYDTRYENLVLSGRMRCTDGAEVPFFLGSGVHERGFPWGDGGSLSDVLLVVGDGKGGFLTVLHQRSHAGRSLSRHLRRRLPLPRDASGMTDGYSASFSLMRAAHRGSSQSMRTSILLSRLGHSTPWQYPSLVFRSSSESFPPPWPRSFAHICRARIPWVSSSLLTPLRFVQGA